MSEPRVAASYVRLLYEYLSQQGQDAVRLLGPEPSGQAHFVPMSDWQAMLAKVQALEDRPALSLRVAGCISTYADITAISREVFDRTPTMHIEGALALGATKWEVVKTTVLPFGRAGYISASMLGLGRALGETIAVLIILASTTQTFGFSLFDGGDTIASKIARAASEFNDPKGAGAYIAAGLVLFVLTFIVNAFARWIIAGHKEYE